jgi:RNA polymerase sigma factor (sigma-70 family)
MDESALIRSIQTDDNRSAYAFLVRRYQSSLRAYLRNLCNAQPELADDLAQEAFLRAYRAIKSFDGRAKFSTWLFQIARNVYFDEMRRHRTMTPVEDEASVTPDMDSRVDLNSALARIPEAEHEALLLSYVEGFSHDEIAKITSSPVGTVKSRILQAKEKLSRIFSSEVSHAIG